MIKKFVLGFALSGGLLAAAPVASANEECFARYNCFFVLPEPGHHNGYWVCPDPNAYLLCSD